MMHGWVGRQRKSLGTTRRQSDADMRGVGVQICIQIISKVKAEQLCRIGDTHTREMLVGEIVVQPVGGGNGLNLGANEVGEGYPSVFAAEEVSTRKVI